MDWGIMERKDELVFLMVDAHDLDSVLGELKGVVISECSISEGLTTDTKVSAKVVTEAEDDGYITNARIRIIHKIEAQNYTEELFTGFVTDISRTQDGFGHWKTEYSLDSSLYACTVNMWAYDTTVGKKASILKVLSSWLEGIGLTYNFSKAVDHRYGSSRLYESTTTVMTSMSDLTGDYDHWGVNGHGVITLTRYTSPAKREASVDITNAMILGDISESSSRSTVPSTVVAFSQDKKKVALASVNKSSPVSFDSRGYSYVTSVTVDGDKPSKSQVRNAAKKQLNASQDYGRTFELTILWHALHQGDMVTIPYRGRTVKCQVTSVEKSFKDMTEKLTLKEATTEWID